MAKAGAITPRLDPVPETLLWTLYHRALEARRADSVLADPLAAELVDRLDYPFEERFGASRAQAQWQALRALRFDREVERFLEAHPDGTVVALGEGLETQFWRVDNGRVRWLSVDLPEAADLRARLLPPSPRQTLVAGSALDAQWLDEVDDSRGVLVTAQGLLMYLEPQDARRLLATCAARFPGATLVFDTVPRWLSERTMRGVMETSPGYRSPPMPWAWDAAERARLEATPGVAEVRELRLPRGRGVLLGYILPFAALAGRVRRLHLSLVRVRFG
jgi:O-methyltransferase involved in polyketide biosynthesis